MDQKHVFDVIVVELLDMGKNKELNTIAKEETS